MPTRSCSTIQVRVPDTSVSMAHGFQSGTQDPAQFHEYQSMWESFGVLGHQSEFIVRLVKTNDTNHGHIKGLLMHMDTMQSIVCELSDRFIDSTHAYKRTSGAHEYYSRLYEGPDNVCGYQWRFVQGLLAYQWPTYITKGSLWNQPYIYGVFDDALLMMIYL